MDIHKSHGKVLKVLSDPYYSLNHQYFSEIGLFVQKGAGVKADYDRAVEEYYRSKIEDVDFGASGSGEVVSAVNRSYNTTSSLQLLRYQKFICRWITESTKGGMRWLLEKEPGSHTRLLVGSVARITPQWLYPFDPDKTSRNGLFFLTGGGRSVDVFWSGGATLGQAVMEMMTIVTKQGDRRRSCYWRQAGRQSDNEK